MFRQYKDTLIFLRKRPVCDKTASIYHQKSMSFDRWSFESLEREGDTS